MPVDDTIQETGQRDIAPVALERKATAVPRRLGVPSSNSAEHPSKPNCICDFL